VSFRIPLAHCLHIAYFRIGEDQRRICLNTYMVVAKFRPDTDMKDVYAVRDQEMATFDALKTAGRLGSLHASLRRGTVFIEAFAHDETSAEETVMSLPMARYWTIDVYPTPALPPPGV